MAYTDVFGGSTVQPSDVQFASVALSANITTAWPVYATGTTQVMARIMKVVASVGSLTISLPDATKTGTGQDVLFDNSGSNTFTVLDFAGNVVATMTAGQVKYLYLSDASTQAGSWRVSLFGAAASALDAASLAGLGLKAITTTLNTAAVTTVINSNTSVLAADRSKVFVWTGVSGTVTLPTTVGSTSDYAIEVRNQGTGTLTLAPVGGSVIDGSSTITLSVGESCFVHMGAADWYTVGRGRNTAFNFTQLSKVITGGSTTLTLTEASNVVQKYTGALVSNATVVLPAVVQVYYVSNSTTGLFTLTFSCAAGGTTVQVTQNQAAILFCDGTNIVNANTSIQGGISTLQFGPGSVTAPSVAFNEVATGFYQYASHEIGVTSNGVYLGRFTSLGWLGAVNGTLGATTPAAATVTTLTATGATVLNGTTIPATSTLLTTLTGAPINSPTFTGTVVLPSTTSIGLVSSTEIGYVDGVTSAIQGQIDAKAPIASPTFTGTVTIPGGANISGYAPIASPTFTGVPTAPTPATLDNSTTIATTAYVVNRVASAIFTGYASTIRESQTATASQTVFNLTNTYQVGTNSINIYINGVRQFSSAYAETTNQRITFTSGLTAGDVVLFEIGVVTSGTTTAASAVSYSPTTNLADNNVQDALTTLAGRGVEPFVLMNLGVI